jgi:hypothetical protein
MIDIALLSGTTLNDILVLVEKEDTNAYEIFVPKSTQLYFSEKSSIAYDYAYAAYAGELLSSLGTNFTYEQVPPEFHESIGFTFQTNDKQKLATTILEISYLYVNDRDDPEYLDIEDVNQFLEDVENGNLKPACPYLSGLFFEFWRQSEAENDDDES